MTPLSRPAIDNVLWPTQRDESRWRQRQHRMLDDDDDDAYHVAYAVSAIDPPGSCSLGPITWPQRILRDQGTSLLAHLSYTCQLILLLPVSWPIRTTRRPNRARRRTNYDARRKDEEKKMSLFPPFRCRILFSSFKSDLAASSYRFEMLMHTHKKKRNGNRQDQDFAGFPSLIPLVMT